ncbi:MAG: WYL domain-containing protein [Bacteroidaceae bacterium]|nr:WYL domain-containing protein [Bacteroidaceae bacterium]
MEQPKIERMLHFITLLADKRGYTIDEIAEKLEISRRSAYRYIDTFKNARFIFSYDNGRYRLITNKGTMKELADTIWFTEEEAYVIKTLIDELDNTNGMKAGLMRKLTAISDMTNLGDFTYNKTYSLNVSRLAEAMKEHKKVMLKKYSSAHSNDTRDHIVEPFVFTSNSIDVWAFDTEDNKNKRFKITRINEVQVLDSNWENAANHNAELMDDFRTHGDGCYHIKLQMDRMAKDLLSEEYPLSEKHISEIDGSHWLYEADVYKLEGIGRFVMGLYEHIIILDGKELKDYIMSIIEKMINDFLGSNTKRNRGEEFEPDGFAD